MCIEMTFLPTKRASGNNVLSNERRRVRNGGFDNEENGQRR